MNKLLVFCIATLMILGCNKNDTDLESAKQKIAEEKAADPAESSSIDPAFKDYQYPDADFDGKFSMGNIVSVSYFSKDDYSKVVDFYNQKFPGSAIQSGTTQNFSKQNPDGSHISATISQLDDKTQIILKFEKK